MFNLIQWNENLDLDELYAEAARRGFLNNASQKAMVDCLRNEREWSGWVLYQDTKAMGYVAAHSFDNVMGPNSYRICVRTCILPHNRTYKAVISARRAIAEHQNLTSQYFIPKCIEWAGKDKNLYITSNENSAGSQKLVHTIFFPTLAKTGVMKRIDDIFYRGSNQTVWQLNTEQFLKELAVAPKWE